ncbi:MAG: ATP-binding protein [Chloroflexota bacterium]
MTSKNNYPFVISLITNPKLQVYFAVISLCLITVYSVSVYIYRPYDNLAWSGVNVYYIGPKAEEAGFQIGDRLLEVDGMPVTNAWEQKPLYRPFIRPGDVVSYKLQRGEQVLTINLVMGSYFDEPTRLAKILIEIFLAMCFWAFGSILCIFAQPMDIRARLIGCSWLLIGIALVTGIIGDVTWFWGHGILMKVCFALLFFVLIAQHIYFPVPSFTATQRRWIIWMIAFISSGAVILILVDDLYIKPQLNLYSGLNMVAYISFLLSVVVSILLLLRNLFRVSDPDVRRQTGIVICGTALGFAPFLVLNLLPSFLSIFPVIDAIYTLPFLLFIPLSYAYVIYQRKLLKIDWIINRLVVLFVVILFILLLSVLILGPLARWLDLSPELPLIGGLFTALFFVSTSGLDKRVQVGVDRVLYGTYYDHTLVTSSLSNRLAHTLDRQSLTYLLTGLFSEQMGIQKSALLLVKGDQLSIQPGADGFFCNIDDALCATLLAASGPMRTLNLWELITEATQTNWQFFGWGEVFAPLIFQDRLQGILILGGRSANSLYSEQDIGIIKTVSDQSALAFANIQHVEELDGLAQEFVCSEEEHRFKVSQDLHDTVLQNLCVVRLGVTDPVLGKYLDDMMDQVRDTIKNQRPRALRRGIIDALEELVQDMGKILPPGTKLIWRNEIEGSLQTSDELATHTYRIAYEAILNAIKYAHASAIRVSIARIQDKLRLCVEDDGIGMPKCHSPEQHYGLSGMSLRARIINARLGISSVVGDGTEITLEATICQ